MSKEKSRWSSFWLGDYKADGDLEDPVDRSEGWKTDPANPQGQRYWSGSYWSARVRGPEVEAVEEEVVASDGQAVETNTHQAESQARSEAPSNAGWYPDPEQAHTVRYWDGSAWTDQRAPATADIKQPRSSGGSVSGRLMALLILAIVGAIIAVVGTFLPLANTAIGINIADNTLIQDPLGIAVIVFAIAAALMASFVVFSEGASSSILIGVGFIGLGIALVAVVVGSNLPIEPINKASERLLEESPASAGSGIWAVGVGGGLILLSSFFGLDSEGWGKVLGDQDETA